jgi:hypothetical protein
LAKPTGKRTDRCYPTHALPNDTDGFGLRGAVSDGTSKIASEAEKNSFAKADILFCFSLLFFFAVLLYFITARYPPPHGGVAVKLFAANGGKSKAPRAAIQSPTPASGRLK